MKSLIHKIRLFGILSLFPFFMLPAQEQAGLKGQVLDSISHEPIVGITILLHKNNTDAVHSIVKGNNQGEFSIPDYSSLKSIRVRTSENSHEAKKNLVSEFSPSNNAIIFLSPKKGSTRRIKLKGQVLDSISLESIKAGIFLHREGPPASYRYLRSDENGRFIIPDCSEAKSISFEKRGGDHRKTFLVSELSPSENITILLPPKIQEQKSNIKLFSVKGNKQIYFASKDNSLVSRNWLDALKKLPGVETKENKIFVSDRIPTILINGEANFLIDYESVDLFKKQTAATLESIEMTNVMEGDRIIANNEDAGEKIVITKEEAEKIKEAMGEVLEAESEEVEKLTINIILKKGKGIRLK